MMMTEIKLDPPSKCLTAFKAGHAFEVLFEPAGLKKEGEWFFMPERHILGSTQKQDKTTYTAVSAHATKEEAQTEAKRLRSDGHPAKLYYARRVGVQLQNGAFARNTWTVWVQLDDDIRKPQDNRYLQPWI